MPTPTKSNTRQEVSPVYHSDRPKVTDARIATILVDQRLHNANVLQVKVYTIFNIFEYGNIQLNSKHRSLRDNDDASCSLADVLANKNKTWNDKKQTHR